MKMIDMKMSKAKQEEAANAEPSKEEYPYGLQINLNDESMKKFGMEKMNHKPGDKMQMIIECSVKGISSHEDEGKKLASMDIQIEKMAHIEPSDKRPILKWDNMKGETK